jgi:hypothetical protein
MIWLMSSPLHSAPLPHWIYGIDEQKGRVVLSEWWLIDCDDLMNDVREDLLFLLLG